jgi:hypothetical protein
LEHEVLVIEPPQREAVSEFATTVIVLNEWVVVVSGEVRSELGHAENEGDNTSEHVVS